MNGTTKEPAPTAILIAEDQVMMRSALATLLDLEEDLHVVAQVGRGDQVLAAAREARPEVLLLDIELPGRSGLDVLAEVVAELPGCVVLILTTFARPGYLRRAMAGGARGFLLKDDPVSELAASIRRALAGEIVIDQQFAAQTLHAPADPLTEREHEVLVASADGATIAGIAAELQLAPSTVRNYLSSAITKTAARNRAEALGIARDRGWL